MALPHDTLTKVIEARAKSTSIQVTPETLNNPEAFKKFQAAQGDLGSALSRLMVVSEQYPTENNNGVLIYLLLAERKIELLADRGVNAHVTEAVWRGMVQRMEQAFACDRFEDGLTQALEEISAVLVSHFPLTPGASNPNELPDDPQRR